MIKRPTLSRMYWAAPVLMLLVAAAPSASQENAPAAAERGGAKAVLSSDKHDFGTVARADIAETTFEITNEGTEALVIRDVQTSCACTVVDLDRRIEPGEKGEVKVSVDTDFIDGTYQVTAQLFTNDPDQPRIDLTLKVETTPYVYAEPGFVRYRVHQNFPGDGAVRQIVYANKPNEFNILRVESTLPQLKSTFREVPEEQRDERHQGAQWIVESRLDKDAPSGTMAGWLRIYTDHPKQSKASIPVTGFVRPVFAVTPHEADFGSVDPDGEKIIRASLHVKQFATDPIDIESVEIDVEGINPEIEVVDEGRAFFLLLTMEKDMKKGPFAGVVKMHTSSDLDRVVEVNVFGTVL